MAAEPAPRAAAEPLRFEPITAVILAGRRDGVVADTLTSLEAEAPPGLEVVLVADDIAVVPARAAGRVHRLIVLGRDAEGIVAGLRAALAARRGSGPVLLLRAGEQLRRGFIRRAADGLELDPQLAYVTAHAFGYEPDCVPLGNAAAQLLPEYDVAATAALLRADAVHAALADPRADQDGDARALFAALAGLGRFGAVIPEPVVTHRAPEVRRDPSSRGLWSALARTAI